MPITGPTGNVLDDISDYRNNAPFAGGMTGSRWSSDGEGHALTLNGNTDYLVANSNSPLQLGLGDASLCAWVKFSTVQNEDFGTVVTNGVLSGSVKGHGIFVDNVLQTIRYQVRSLGTSQVIGSDNVLNDGQWHHIVGVLDRSSITGQKLYIDGVLQTSQDDGTTFNGVNLDDDTEFSIGTRFSLGSNNFYFRGSIAYVAQYGRALSGREICQQYNEPRALVEFRDRPVRAGAVIVFTSSSSSISTSSTSSSEGIKDYPASKSVTSIGPAGATVSSISGGGPMSKSVTVIGPASSSISEVSRP